MRILKLPVDFTSSIEKFVSLLVLFHFLGVIKKTPTWRGFLILLNNKIELKNV